MLLGVFLQKKAYNYVGLHHKKLSDKIFSLQQIDNIMTTRTINESIDLNQSNIPHNNNKKCAYFNFVH